MAYDVLEIQNQVALMTGHNGLATRTITWTNRVIQEIATRAYWQRQIAQIYVRYASTTGVATTSLSDLWITAGSLTQKDIINIYRADHVSVTGTLVSSYFHQIVRRNAEGLFANLHGQTFNVTGAGASGRVNQYAVVGWSSDSTVSTQFEPKIAVFPNALTTDVTVEAMQLHYLKSPQKFTAVTDTNWILRDYFNVVLSGVLRLARLYLGDAQGYLLEKREYEDGIKRMLMQEESPVASTPVMRGVVPEEVRRGL